MASLIDRVVSLGADVPRLLTLILVTLVVITVGLLVLPRSTAVALIALMLLIAPFPGWVSVVYLWRVYLADESRPRSWLLLLVAFIATIVQIALLPIALLAAIVILPQITISGDDATLMLGMALLAAASVPTLLGLVFAARRRGLATPPGYGPTFGGDIVMGGPGGTQPESGEPE
jgi:RsiW-degrading membrane proteinase PrsW (M82 family)